MPPGMAGTCPCSNTNSCVKSIKCLHAKRILSFCNSSRFESNPARHAGEPTAPLPQVKPASIPECRTQRRPCQCDIGRPTRIRRTTRVPRLSGDTSVVGRKRAGQRSCITRDRRRSRTRGRVQGPRGRGLITDSHTVRFQPPRRASSAGCIKNTVSQAGPPCHPQLRQSAAPGPAGLPSRCRPDEIRRRRSAQSALRRQATYWSARCSLDITPIQPVDWLALQVLPRSTLAGSETGSRCVPAMGDKAGAAPATVDESWISITPLCEPAWEGADPGSCIRS